MPRARLISPEFWTSEAVVDCAPMTRLLLLGLGNFADDFGVLPMRPRTVRLQVFPGDALGDDQVRAMIEALIARGLVRRYAVEGVDYLSIVDWEIHQRVGRHARRRYPACPSAALASAPSAPDHSKPKQSAAADAGAAPPSAPLDLRAEVDHPDPPPAGDDAVEEALRQVFRADLPADVASHARACDQPPHGEAVDAAMPAPPPPNAMAQTTANHRTRAAA